MSSLLSLLLLHLMLEFFKHDTDNESIATVVLIFGAVAVTMMSSVESLLSLVSSPVSFSILQSVLSL